VAGREHPTRFDSRGQFWLEAGADRVRGRRTCRRVSRFLAIANVLLGVAHNGTSMWAVGYYFTATGTEAGVQRTLIERYTC
jgi:hypothetical protein